MTISAIFDASGKIPTSLTAHEKAWADAVESGAVKASFDELRRKQALSLDEKITISRALIQDWYEAWDGSVCVSYSGGKDSSVLLWLVRQLYPDVPAVFCNTGLEYPEIVRLVKATPHHVVLRPKMPFHQVVNTYGWPIASKKIARGITILRNPTERNQNIWRLYDQGINRYGKPVHGFKVSQCWRFLVDAPFPVSDMCCKVMKKDPMHLYEKETGHKSFVGTLASDSKARQRIYLKTGCNAYDAAHPRSAPLSFWTEQDILQCIKEYNIPLASVYGEVCEKNGVFSTSGLSRTGCVFCCFGLHLDHLDGEQNRFQQLAKTHPKLHSYCIDRLGLREVLQYCKDHAGPQLAKHFVWRPSAVSTQLSLFDTPPPL
ncbi:MAG: phosphoadenosine phosphosulfate reductase family protein [Pseudomonadota bacterium]